MFNDILNNRPLVKEIPYSEPIGIFALFSEDPGAIFLDSANKENENSQYSFIALDPFLTLSSKNGEIKFGATSVYGDPFLVLQNQLREFTLQTHPALPPFQGGVAGYFSYDLCQHLEKLSQHKIDDMQFPDMALGFYDLVIAFDHQRQAAWIFSSGYPERTTMTRQKRAEERCRFLFNEINRLQKPRNTTQEDIDFPNYKISANLTSEDYRDMVQQVIDYIYAGDIFQANVSQRFQAKLSAKTSSFSLYQNLRRINPAPFAAYLNFFDMVIASASPERFVKLANGIVETRPIKGTRPRGSTYETDRKFKHELVNSTKDQAENTMIVDLMRNDLSRVCCDHSVQVTQLCKLESYATVHHLVSSVMGELRTGLDAVDLIRATFPGGSITGAPKIRAMEIIAELEPTCRGPYCGSIGYIGFDGCMDLSITIRTYVIKDGYVTFQTGGGIVADSVPEEEYQEMLTKAAALHQALNSNI